MTDELKLPQVGELTLSQWQEWLVRYNAILTDKERRIEQLQSSLANAYADCLECVAGIKQDSFTEIAEIFKIDHSSTLTAKDFMVAIAEDIEKAIKVRAALAGEKKE